MKGWSGLLHSTALDLIAALEKVDPTSPTLAVAKAVFAAAGQAGVRPSGRPTNAAASLKRMKRAIRDVDDARAASLYQSGQSQLEVATAMGRSQSYVRAALGRLGIPARAPGPDKGFGVDHDRVERIRGMRADGKSLEAIGAAEHITRQRVQQICVANGIDTRASAELDDRQLAAVGEYLTGQSLEKVGFAYDVTPGTVKKWVFRAGHIPRQRSRRIGPETKAKAAQAAKLYEAGWKGRDIAAEVGLSDAAAVYRLLAMEGVSPTRNFGSGRAAK